MMRKSQGSLERLEAAMRLANPVPHPSALADSSESLAVSRLVSRRRHAMRPEPTASPEARHHWRGIAIAATAFVVALAIALPLWLLRGGDEPPAVATSVTTTITASTIATTTTTAATATQEIVVASISVEDASPSVGGPLVAVSAREAWLGMTPSAESGTTLIGHLEDGTWSFYRLDRLRNWMAGILGLAVAPDGMVWAATNVGVFSFDGAEWTRRFDGPAGAVVVDQGGTVWIGGGRLGDGSGWLARWDGVSWQRLDDGSGRPALGPAALIAVLPNGEAWMRLPADYWGARMITDPLRYDGATLEIADLSLFPDRDPYVVSGTSALEVAPNGDLWAVGGAEFLGRFDGEAWTLHEAPIAIRLFDSDIAVGPDGVVWFTSGGLPEVSDGGLGSFDGTGWTTHIEGRPVWSVDVAPDGTVWYTDPEGVHTLSTP